jgi:hypothetical protein
MCRDTFNIAIIATTAIDRQKIGHGLPGKQRVMPDVAVVIHSLLTIGDKGF